MKSQISVAVRQKAQQQTWLMIQNFWMVIEHLVMQTQVVQTAVRTSIGRERR
jgi:hypothetical protein